MTDPSKAVFLSYASQDAEAAQRICEALRAAGIEVWFDQSELTGGDAWDHQIRQQIHDCALFVPIISANTQARPEGYFRLEWRLADQRTHLMGKSRAFLVPVCVDDTRDSDADVPDSFSAVQWTRLAGGETPPAFAERVRRLLSPSDGQPTAPGPPSAGRTATSPPAASTRAQSRRTALVLVLVALTVAVIGAGYLAVDKFVLSRRVAVGTPASVVAGAAAQRAIPEKSIAVLPFVDMSEKKDQEYFSDGLSEELIDLLAKGSDMRVPARTSSFYFKGKQATISEIATALGVANVLEGSVRKSGQTLRVTAQLIRAADGYHIWSESYDRELKDVFKVQDEIAAAVVAALKAKLFPTWKVGSARLTASAEAYSQYLIGRQGYIQGTLDSTRTAIAAFRQAITFDPRFAAAYAGLATAKAFVAMQLADGRAGDGEALRQALADAERAIALDPNLADGYSARGVIRLYQWEWVSAAADLLEAVTVDPHDSVARRRYSRLLADLGRLPEAIAGEQQATELDPLDGDAWYYLGTYLVSVGRLAEAKLAYRRVLEINAEAGGVRWDLANIAFLEGRTQAFLDYAKQEKDDALRLADVAIAEDALGHRTESQQALDELIARFGGKRPSYVVSVYARREDRDHAFQWIDRAYAIRDTNLESIKYDNDLANLRGDSRYKAMLHKMNLPE